MGRSPCCEKAHTNRGAWTKEEDQLLISYIRAYGEGCWRSLPKAAGLQRCGKSCRLRWINYLRPDLKRGNFTEEEDELIIKLHSIIGNKHEQYLVLQFQNLNLSESLSLRSQLVGLCSQMVSHRWAIIWEDRQRDQELLEHTHKAQAHRPRAQPQDSPAT